MPFATDALVLLPSAPIPLSARLVVPTARRAYGDDPQAVPDPPAARASFRRRRGGTSGCTSRAWARTTRTTRSRSSCAARARYVYDEHGKRYLDGLSALFCVNAGHGRAELGEAAADAGQGARLLHELELRAPAAIELAARVADARPGRPQPRVLHLGRLGGGRVGAGSCRAQYHKLTRQPAEVQDHLARDRLPRHHLRRALDHGHHAAAHAVRAARARRATTCRTRTTTAGPRTATRSGRPTRSST